MKKTIRKICYIMLICIPIIFIMSCNINTLHQNNKEYYVNMHQNNFCNLYLQSLEKMTKLFNNTQPYFIYCKEIITKPNYGYYQFQLISTKDIILINDLIGMDVYMINNIPVIVDSNSILLEHFMQNAMSDTLSKNLVRQKLTALYEMDPFYVYENRDSILFSEDYLIIDNVKIQMPPIIPSLKFNYETYFSYLVDINIIYHLDKITIAEEKNIRRKHRSFFEANQLKSYKKKKNCFCDTVSYNN